MLLGELTALCKDISVLQSMKLKKTLLAAIGIQGRDGDIVDAPHIKFPRPNQPGIEKWTRFRRGWRLK